MTDLGVPYDTKKATEGMAEGDPNALKTVHAPPGEAGTPTPEAAKQHAYATTARDDPPCEQSGGHHGHHGNPKK